MERNEDKIEVLITLYLKGEATPEQAMEIEDWKNANDANQKLFSKMEETYHITHNISKHQPSNVDKAWGKVQPVITKENTIIPIWKKPSFYYTTTAAAVILLAFVLGNLWTGNTLSNKEIAKTNRSNTEEQVVKSRTILATAMVQSFTLQDQTKIRLEPGSKIVVDADFNVKGRKLTMKGSGTFEVIHDESNPFSIDIEGLNVLDIGTVFHLKTVEDTVKVKVDEGVVALSVNGKTLQVSEGDSAFYIISQQVISRYKQAQAIYKKQVFEFDGTTLKEVAAILSDFYGKKIVIMDKEIEGCPVNVTFKNEELATILDIIKELLDVKVIKNKDIIGIYGKGCM